MSDRDARVQAAHLGFHPDRLRKLMEMYGGASRLVGAVAAGQLAAPGPVVAIEQLAGRLADLGVEAVARGDAVYPERLAVLPDSPDVLFVRGKVPAGPAVAVVGTRRASGYGLRFARAFGRVVAAAGWVVVSGLARGVDGQAHRGCVDAGGVGVAVLGSGPDVMYPAEHASLAGALVGRGGAVVTEYPPGAPPEPWRFPPRNRIISGLADAVVVVEAAVKGGALITAGAALVQGRPVFVLPGDVDRATSEGCNLLIRDGAHPVLGPDDLVEALTLAIGPPPVADLSHPDQFPAWFPAAGATLEDLVARTGQPAGAVMATLAGWEAEGRVVRDGPLIVPTRAAGPGSELPATGKA